MKSMMKNIMLDLVILVLLFIALTSDTRAQQTVPVLVGQPTMQDDPPTQQSSSSSCVPVPSDIVAWWPMNDPNSSTSLQEVVGGNNAGPQKSPVGSAQGPQAIAGVVGGAINFIKFPGSGLTGAIVGNMSGPLVFIGSADFSIDAWIKFPPTSTAGRRHYIINKIDGPAKKGYGLYIVRPSNSSSSYLEFVWGDGSAFHTVTSSAPVPPNQWNLVGVTFARNTSAGTVTVRLYVNGMPQATTTVASTGSLVNYISISIGFQPSSIDEPIAIDELQIFKTALPPGYFQSLYNAGSAGSCMCTQKPSGMVGWWWMDGNANDYAPLGGFNNPSATNAITFVPGKVGQGVTFGPGGYIDIPHSPALANQQFTVDAWVKPQGPGPNNDFLGSVIVQKGMSAPSGYTTVSFSLWWSAQQQRFIFGFGNISTERIVSSSTFPAGQFYHVAATYDGSTFKLYVNGALQGQQALVKTITYDSAIPWTIGSTSAPFRAVGFPRTFNGVIDEVEIFNRALSQAEIQAIYNAGSAGKCKP